MRYSSRGWTMASYLICYDISEPKRLARLHRYLRRYALPLQYSVFLFVGDGRTLEGYLMAMRKLINEKEDDLRCYPLPQRGSRQCLGCPVMPEGIFWSALPSEATQGLLHAADTTPGALLGHEEAGVDTICRMDNHT